MLQLERLNVVEETLKQLENEMRDNKFDDNMDELYKAAIGCRFYASRVHDFVHKKIYEPEAFENENS